MRKIISSTIIMILTLFLLSSLTVNAATTTVIVKTSVHTYKGQPYVQLSGGNKPITAKINKTLKNHAVIAAGLDSKNKKINKDYYHKTWVETKYNSNGKISVVYEVSSYLGGAHDHQYSTIYNFDLKTGKRINLGDIAGTENRIYNLFNAVSSDLMAKYKKGRAIFEDNFYDIPLTPNSNFYFYDKGIVVRFDPYEVAPFSEGFVDCFVNYATLDKSVSKVPSTKPNIPTPDVIKSQIDDDFEGYDENNLYELSNGQIWKQDEYKYYYSYSYRPEVIIYKEGSSYYMQVEGMDDPVKVKRIK